MAYVAEQKKLYALAKDGKTINTSAKEIEQFFGILFFTGIFPCKAYPMYWCIFSRFPLIAYVMSRNRFQVLLCYDHFNDSLVLK